MSLSHGDLLASSGALHFSEASPNVIWMDLAKFKLTKGSPVLLLHPDDIKLTGDVTKSFKPGTIGF
jgi:hypothetical protein